MKRSPPSVSALCGTDTILVAHRAADCVKSKHTRSWLNTHDILSQGSVQTESERIETGTEALHRDALGGLLFMALIGRRFGSETLTAASSRRCT